MLVWDRKGKTTTPTLAIIQKLKKKKKKKSAGIAAPLMGAGGSFVTYAARFSLPRTAPIP